MYRGASVHSHDLMPLQHVLSAALQAGICLGWPLSRIRLQIKDSAIALAPLEQLYIGGTFGHLQIHIILPSDCRSPAQLPKHESLQTSQTLRVHVRN